MKADWLEDELKLVKNQLIVTLNQNIDTFHEVQISVVVGDKKVIKLVHNYECLWWNIWITEMLL